METTKLITREDLETQCRLLCNKCDNHYLMRQSKLDNSGTYYWLHYLLNLTNGLDIGSASICEASNLRNLWKDL